MMMEIIRELTTIKEANNITSEQFLCWAKGVEVQRVQKVLLFKNKREKESKEFDAIKKTVKQNNRTQNIKKYRNDPEQR